jgi:hypothetical protein
MIVANPLYALEKSQENPWFCKHIYILWVLYHNIMILAPLLLAARILDGNTPLTFPFSSPFELYRVPRLPVPKPKYYKVPWRGMLPLWVWFKWKCNYIPLGVVACKLLTINKWPRWETKWGQEGETSSIDRLWSKEDMMLHMVDYSLANSYVFFFSWTSMSWLIVLAPHLHFDHV